MISYEGEIVISRPVAAVFDYVTNFENFTKWSDTHAVTRLSNGDSGVGTRLKIDMGRGPLRSQIEFETVEWEPEKVWGFKTVASTSMAWDGMYGFEPIGAGSTRLTAAGQVSLNGWRRLLEPLVRAELRKGEQAELGKLKELLEANAG